MRKIVFLLAMTGLLALLAGAASAANNVDIGGPPGGIIYDGNEAVVISAGGDYSLTLRAGGTHRVNHIIISDTATDVTLRLENQTNAPMVLQPSFAGIAALSSNATGTLTLEVAGPVTLAGNGDVDGVYTKGDLVIRGTGTLEVRGKGEQPASIGAALHSEGSLRLRGGVTVQAVNTSTAANAGGFGVLADSLVMDGGAKLTDTSGPDDGPGISVSSTIRISGQAEMNGYGARDGISCARMEASGSAQVTGVGNSYGIDCGGSTLIASGDARVTGIGKNGPGIYTTRYSGMVVSDRAQVQGSATNNVGIQVGNTLTVSGKAQVTGRSTSAGHPGLECHLALTASDSAQVTGNGIANGLTCYTGLFLSGQSVVTARGANATPGTGDALYMVNQNIPLLSGTAPKLYVQNTARDEQLTLDRDPATTEAFLAMDGVTSSDPLSEPRIRARFPRDRLAYVSVSAPVPTAVPTAVPGATVPPTTGDGSSLGLYIVLLCAAGLLWTMKKTKQICRSR